MRIHAPIEVPALLINVLTSKNTNENTSFCAENAARLRHLQAETLQVKTPSVDG